MAVNGPVATITIDNPPLNILTANMRRMLLEFTRDLSQRGDVLAVVIEGSGERAFCAGSDINEFPKDAMTGCGKVRIEQHVLDRLMNLPQITVAKLRGHVLGGGAAVMLACDLRIAAQGVRIGFPEIKVGVFPAGGGTHFVARQIPMIKAKELVLLGESIGGEEALASGLINRLVLPGELDSTVARFTDRLSELPGNALTAAKRALNTAYTGSYEQGQTVELEEFTNLFGHANMAEGVAAFFEKRPPRFNR
jgi:enoyl-CoA hydratase/carnithine racemase